MGLPRSIQRPQNEQKIPPKRTALTRRRPPNCAKTVRGLVLATPDELEGDNMRVRKLRSRSTTFQGHWSTQQKQRGAKFENTCRAAATSRRAPEQPRTPLNRYAFRAGAGAALYFCLHLPMAAPRLLVLLIVSARVHLVCLQKIGTLRGIQNSF